MNGLRSRLRTGDLVGLGFHGLRARPMRAALSALGIAIGIAAMIAVVGISTSSEALVKQRLAALGTNLLTASAGKDFFGADTALPSDAVDRVRRVDGVEQASWTSVLDQVHVYRNDRVDRGATQGLSVAATDLELLGTTSSTLASGSWLNATSERYPAVVLGAKVAERLGIVSVGSMVQIGDQEFTVVGILARSPLAPELDVTALVGGPIASELFAFDGSPTTVYERGDDERVAEVRRLLPSTIDPESPTEVKVSRPSDALAAKNTIDQAFTGLLVGIGSIALLVGGIGVANTMVITVLERRQEIGLRRSLGATRGHIRSQFLVEAMLLALCGGIAGTVIGWAITAVVAASNGWLVAVPAAVLVAGVAATVVVGAVAGALPAARAARTSPTAALNS
ncbi:putative ABC transport system permease protein [Agromyces sp. CF514]|uniref:ABC transporter permease n=1 Tax=Agromyces sp. CF514 TaxID=1881031 RepID=UPI0008E0A915|nr:ABC transporter permease [Agromyces sp. CF514]SFR69935.1 putative ABC transport system permease protein [Agromyces sp. CF514]